MAEGKIYAALAKCIAAVGVVGKTRKNAAQGYQFRGIDDVLSACQSVLADNGVVCVPQVREREREMVQTKSGGSMASVRLLVDHHFYAADGTFVTATTLGEAMDSGDKASNKAMSAALKYALVETLCIPTFEDDRDTEEHSPEIAAPAKSKTPAKVPPKPDLAPDPVGIEVEAVIAAATRLTTLAEYETLRTRAKALDGVASTAEYARVSAAMAKRKTELNKGAA
jgi:hypothetical protein